MDKPIFKLAWTTIDCENAQELASFYTKLLGWGKTHETNEYVKISSSDNTQSLLFQNVAEYVEPVWPWSTKEQQQMEHLDFLVDDLEKAVSYSIECGAKKSNVQYHESFLIVMIDPAGHPFCLIKQ